MRTLVSAVAAVLALVILSGRSTSWNVAAGPQAKASPMKVACFTAHGGRSVDMDATAGRIQSRVNHLELPAEIKRPLLAVTPHRHAVVHRNQVTRFVEHVEKLGFPLRLADAQDASPALLRLALKPSADGLTVDSIKRRVLRARSTIARLLPLSGFDQVSSRRCVATTT